MTQLNQQEERVVRTPRGTVIHNPPAARLFFDDTRLAIVWLVLRILLGFIWLNAAIGKLSDPAWMETGSALKEFWTNAVKTGTTGRPPISFEWYRNLIQAMLDNNWYVWFAKLVAVGELLVGVALILGFLVGLSAFIGAFMNWNYLMAGSASINPILFVGAILLMLAWKTAGYYGLDRYIVPLLGTTWEDEEQEQRPTLTPRSTPLPPH